MTVASNLSPVGCRLAVDRDLGDAHVVPHRSDDLDLLARLYSPSIGLEIAISGPASPDEFEGERRRGRVARPILDRRRHRVGAVREHRRLSHRTPVARHEALRTQIAPRRDGRRG